ncbi:MAG: hypothetical protein IJQ89_07705 [Bacteroidales bacterium]|nr:hypothetical protein [Bacteroidales bacterium]
MRHVFLTIGSLVAMSAIMMMTASCSKEELTLNTSGTHTGVVRYIEATAGMPNNHVNKAFLDIYDNNNVIWENDDVLNINGTNIAAYEVNGTSARFRGEVRALQNTQGDKDIYWAVYPSTLAENNTSLVPANFQLDGLTVTLPATQNYSTVDEKTLIGQYNYMAAYSQVDAGEQNVDFQMRNLGAVLAVTIAPQSGTTLTNSHINKVVFSSENAPMSGTFTVSANSLNPTITGVSDATSDNVAINVSDGQNNYVDISTQPAVVYAVLPPLASKNLTMRIYNTDGYFFEKSTNTATLARNHIYTTSVAINEIKKYDIYYSVSPTKKVLFAPGNLQWSATGGGTTPTTHTTATGTAAGTWRFAEHQWDFVGGVNKDVKQFADATTDYGTVYANGVKCNNKLKSSSYAGWIDLFGWGTSGWDNRANDPNSVNFQPWETTETIVDATYNYYGYGPSTNNSNPDLTGTYYDWGLFNDIYNPKTGNIDPHGTWYTFTYEEWNYFMYLREDAVNKRAHATVNGVYGMVILPDLWLKPNGIVLNPDPYVFVEGVNYYLDNVFTESQWAIMEEAGATFLPAAGYLSTAVELYSVMEFGDYHSGSHYIGNASSIIHSSGECYIPYFTSWSTNDNYSLDFGTGRRWMGRAVRLIKDFVE